MPLFPHLHLGWPRQVLAPVAQNRPPFRLPCTVHSSLCAILSAWAFLALVGPRTFLLHLPIWLRAILTPILLAEPYSLALLPSSPHLSIRSDSHHKLSQPTPLLHTSSPWTPLLLFLCLYALLLVTAHRTNALAQTDSATLFPNQPERITREEAHANLRERSLKLFRICSYLFFVATLCLVQQQWRAATKAATRAAHAFAHRYTDPWRYERPLTRTLERDVRVVEEGIKSELWYAQWGQVAGAAHTSVPANAEEGNLSNNPIVSAIDQPPPFKLVPDHVDHTVPERQNGGNTEMARRERLVNDYVASWLARAFAENNFPLKHHLALTSSPTDPSASFNVSAVPQTVDSAPHVDATTLASVWRAAFLAQWDRVWLALWLGDVLMIGALALLLGWSPRMLVRELWWTTKAIVRDWSRGGRLVARAVARVVRRVGRRVRRWRRPETAG